MNDISNKASICAIVHLEVIDFFKKTDLEQAAIKNQLNNLINLAVIDIAHNNRAILNVADGTVIACIGPLENALEDALLISLTIRDEILENNSLGSTPLYVRFGINLGSAKVSSDVNGKPSIVGESIDEAQRIMSFAKPNQILVSRPYYEMTSKLSQEISQMFEYHDMHANEQDIYAVILASRQYYEITSKLSQEISQMFERPDMHVHEQDTYPFGVHKDLAATEESPSIQTVNSQPEKWQSIISKINWSYVPLSLLVFVAFFVLAKLASTPTEPIITLVQPALKMSPALIVPSASSVTTLPAQSNDDFLLPNESLEKPLPQVSSGETKQIEKKIAQKKIKQNGAYKIVKQKGAHKKARNKSAADTKTETPTQNAAKPAVLKVDKVAEKEKSAEKDKSGRESFKDSVKQGINRQCSQAEIAMNQCR